MIYVIDASVAVKWFVREPLHEEANRLLRRLPELHAPDWILMETAHATFKKWRDGELSAAQMEFMLPALRGSPLHLHPSSDLIDRALAIAMEIQHAIYDCLYIACAETCDGTVVTNDKRLHAAARQTAFGRLVQHLADT